MKRRQGDLSHLRTPEVKAKISASLRGNQKLKTAMKLVHAKQIASGEDAAIREKIKATRVARDDWIDHKDDAFRKYRNEVRWHTNHQDISSLPNSRLRGRGPGKFRLDHIISIKTGFINGLPAWLIGHINNLRFIPEGQNCSKQDRNDLDEVVRFWFENSKEVSV